MPQATFSQILNRSLSEVLARSLATSLSTLLPILALLFFGGQTLQSFAFALAVGVLSGAYSSLFIASPVLMHWKESEPKWRSRRLRVIEENGHVSPYADTEDDVAPTEKKRPTPSLTAPEDPERRVSSEEFKEMVESINDESKPEPAPEAASSGADAQPEDVVMPREKKPKRKRPRRKHGRAR